MSLTVIRRVEPRSPAHWAGLSAGDTLLRVNGKSIADVLDYKFHTYDARLELELRRADGSLRSLTLRKEEGEDLGLSFDTYLMDKARSCANDCIFCFVSQMPPGLRPSLYFKDDDARLSFLLGNYLTLTNLSAREAQRIIDLRVSPINISVHTTNPQLRAEMLKHPRAGEALELMGRFAAAGITMNCQIVACPGVNDGPELARTLSDLARLHPAVGSVSVVPVGVTKFRQGLFPLRPYTGEEAAALVAQVEAFSQAHQERTGGRLVWCSDEFYLLAGLPLHPEAYFEDFPQLENGVGMLPLLRGEFCRALELLEPEEVVSAPFTIATGVSAAPFLREMVDMARCACDRIEGTVVPIRNEFFGQTITVAGLVTGGDLIRQLTPLGLSGRLLIPASMLRAGEREFLDDTTLEDVEAALGLPVSPVESDGYALLDAMAGLSPPPLPSPPPGNGTEYHAYHPPRRPGDATKAPTE